MADDTHRSRRWTTDPAPRYWWHRLPGMDFVPPVYASLTDDEWSVIADWYAETDRAAQIGEAAVPLMSLLHGLVMGNRAARIVQLGTHAGYSALLLGFMLRQMNAARGLFTLDIDREFCGIARRWLERAELLDFVEVAEGDSLDPASAARAREYLGGAPELIILDSSHEYRLNAAGARSLVCGTGERWIARRPRCQPLRAKLRCHASWRRSPRVRRMARRQSDCGNIPAERRSAIDGSATPILQRRVRRRVNPQARRLTKRLSLSHRSTAQLHPKSNTPWHSLN